MNTLEATPTLSTDKLCLSMLLLQQKKIKKLMKEREEKQDQEEELELYRFSFVLAKYHDGLIDLVVSCPIRSEKRTKLYVKAKGVLESKIIAYPPHQLLLYAGEPDLITIKPTDNENAVEWALRGDLVFLTTPSRSLVLLDQLQSGFKFILDTQCLGSSVALENYQVLKGFCAQCRNKLLTMK